MVNVYNKGKDISSEIIIFILSMLIVQLIFLSIGTLISAVMKNTKVSGAVSVGILFGSFVISKITDLTDKVNFINVLSPFKYFSYQKIVDSNTISIGIGILSAAFIAILIVSTYFFYTKRDLNL